MAGLVGRLRDVAGTEDAHKIIHWEGRHSELKERSKKGSRWPLGEAFGDMEAGVILELGKDEAEDIVLKVTDKDDVDDYKETKWLDKETLTEKID